MSTALEPTQALLDFANPQAGDDTAEIQHLLAELHIGIDGRNYRSRDVRYGRQTDAVAYARIDRATPGYCDEPGHSSTFVARGWPSPADEIALRAACVSYDGYQYRFEQHRYDDMNDALAYARRGR